MRLLKSLLILLTLSLAVNAQQPGFSNLGSGPNLPPTPCGVGSIFVKTTTPEKPYICSGSSWIDLTNVGGGGGSIPSGAILLILEGTCPSGFTEQSALAGKTLIGTLAANSDIGTTGGADAITPTGTNSGTSVANHDAHTHNYTDVINHLHAVNVNDSGHNHTQNPHNHIVTSQTATTGSATSYEHGALDTSSAEAEATETTNNTTATNNISTTGITATTNNPAGGVTTGTTASAALSVHQVTQPTFTGNQFDNRSAFVKVIFCRKD